jgi:hypothetical protein
MAAAKRKVIDWLVAEGRGQAKVTYKLRDWLFSRQRYWGEPFPVLHTQDGVELVPDERLPVELPYMEDFKPGGVPESPLIRAKEWVATKDHKGRPAQREINTMPGAAGSSWYFLRFCDPHNEREFCSKAASDYWLPVDLYVGGTEHAVGHLLYSRFWTKVLHDQGLVRSKEPFHKLYNQGMIQAFAYEDARGAIVPKKDTKEVGDDVVHAATGEKLKPIVTKMSKRYGNVVNPDDVVAEYGADTLRLYEMYMGPLADSKPWNPKDVPGVYRFLQRAGASWCPSSPRRARCTSGCGRIAPTKPRSRSAAPHDPQGRRRHRAPGVQHRDRGDDDLRQRGDQGDGAAVARPAAALRADPAAVRAAPRRGAVGTARRPGPAGAGAMADRRRQAAGRRRGRDRRAGARQGARARAGAERLRQRRRARRGARGGRQPTSRARRS